MPAHYKAQDGLQQDQNGKSFIYFNVISFSLGVGNNQCYLLVVLPGATSGLPLVVLNALLVFKCFLAYVIPFKVILRGREPAYSTRRRTEA